MKFCGSQREFYLVEVPNLEDGLAIKEGVLEEAISCWEGKMHTFRDCAIWEDKLFEKIKVMTT